MRLNIEPLSMYVVNLTLLFNLFYELVISNLKPVTLFCDNRYTMYIAANMVFHERTNTHIYFFIWFMKSFNEVLSLLLTSHSKTCLPIFILKLFLPIRWGTCCLSLELICSRIQAWGGIKRILRLLHDHSIKSICRMKQVNISQHSF